MINQILATKREMRQAWTKTGKRIPVTIIHANDCVVISSSKTQDSLLFGQGTKKLKNMPKAQRSQLEKAGISFGVRLFKQVKATTEDIAAFTPGTILVPSQVLKIGDIVKITGTSKGKGFTGVVKRHGFAGGPRTHGQSDRERAPGSIGAGTTPGRVYRNKRMAGRSGGAQVTTLGLTVVGLNDTTGEVLVKGCVPGAINSAVLLTKTGESTFDGIVGEIEKVEEATKPESEAVQTEQAQVEKTQ